MSDSRTPPVSIVIPVWQRPDELRRCLLSLDGLDFPRERLQIIVADNGSRDTTPDVARELGATVVVERERGAAAARNRGLREATGEIVAFLDSDCEARPRWLAELVAPFADEGVGIVGGRIVGAPPTTVYEEYVERRRVLDQELFADGVGALAPFVATANAAYRRAALEQVGGFDTWFRVAGEDADLAWRVGDLGWELRYRPEAEVLHTHRQSLRSLARLFHNYGAGTVHLLKRHGQRLGVRRTFSATMYRMLLANLVRAPFAVALRRDPYDRLEPTLDALHAASHLAGRWKASLRHGVCGL